MNRDQFNKIVYTAVLVPDVPDYDGDIVSKDQITTLMHNFMRKYQNIDFHHTLNNIDAVILENYQTTSIKTVTMENDIVELPVGTWVMAIEINDEKIIQMIKNRELNGASVTAVPKANKSKGPAKKERITFADLGDDFEVSHVSLVTDPAVFDARFFAFKGIENDVEKKINPLLALFTSRKEKGGTEMKEKEVLELVEKSVGGIIEKKLSEILAAEKAKEDEATKTAAEKAKADKEKEDAEKLAAEKAAAEKAKADAEKAAAEKDKEDVTANKSKIEELEKEIAVLKKSTEVLENAGNKKVDKSVDLGRDAFGRKIK